MSHYFVLLFFLMHYVESNFTSISDKEYMAVSYLNVAEEMIERAKSNMPTCSDTKESSIQRPTDCGDILRMGYSKSSVYTIWPINRLTVDKSIEVYCDMDTDGGGWTLIQRRGNYGSPEDFFYKGWLSYREGFGDIKEDFWLGNDNIFALTNQKFYSVRFDLQDFQNNNRYAVYDYFWIDDNSSQYRLHISDYSGDAGDSMIKEHNNQKFSTKDVDNDELLFRECSRLFKGAWWFNVCHKSNLNGLYLSREHSNLTNGITWFTWKGYSESLEKTEIKIRPRKFTASKDFKIASQ